MGGPGNFTNPTKHKHVDHNAASKSADQPFPIQPDEESINTSHMAMANGEPSGSNVLVLQSQLQSQFMSLRMNVETALRQYEDEFQPIIEQMAQINQIKHVSPRDAEIQAFLNCSGAVPNEANSKEAAKAVPDACDTTYGQAVANNRATLNGHNVGMLRASVNTAHTAHPWTDHYFFCCKELTLRPRDSLGRVHEEGNEGAPERSSSAGHSLRSIGRLKKVKKQREGTQTVDELINELASESPKAYWWQTGLNFRCNRQPILPEDSSLRRCDASAAFNWLRGITWVLDALLILVELQVSTMFLLKNEKDPVVNPLIAGIEGVLCAFFWFDMLLMMALEFPVVDLFYGRSRYRWMLILAIVQQTLSLIFAFAWPSVGRFTWGARSWVYHFSFVRVLRTTLMLPKIGGPWLRKTMNEFHMMFQALTGSLLPLMWCTFMLLVILMIVGVLVTEGAAYELARAAEWSEALTTLAEDWGCLDRSVYSLLTASLGGQDWGDLHQTLEPEPWPIRFGFVCFMIFTYIALLNTVTTVFIQSGAIRLERDKAFIVQKDLERKREYLQSVKAVFKSLDDDKDGIVTFAEVAQHLCNPDVKCYFNRLGVDTDEIEKLFILMDKDFSGTLTLEEFMSGCLRLKGQAKNLDLELMHQELKFAIGTLLDLQANTQKQQELAGVSTQLRELQDRMDQTLSRLTHASSEFWQGREAQRADDALSQSRTTVLALV